MMLKMSVFAVQFKRKIEILFRLIDTEIFQITISVIQIAVAHLSHLKNHHETCVNKFMAYLIIFECSDYHFSIHDDLTN